jgi:hypothetical protein
MTETEPDYSDRPQTCPMCGNPNVGHTAGADWCIAPERNEGEPPSEYGCGWLDVPNPVPVNESEPYLEAKAAEQ